MFYLRALLMKQKIQADHVHLFKQLNRLLLVLQKKDINKFNKLHNEFINESSLHFASEEYAMSIYMKSDPTAFSAHVRANAPNLRKPYYNIIKINQITLDIGPKPRGHRSADHLWG